MLRLDRKVIPRLYSAGELGSFWGMFCQGGGNISECIVFNRIAGSNAAREKRIQKYSERGGGRDMDRTTEADQPRMRHCDGSGPDCNGAVGSAQAAEADHQLIFYSV